MKSSFFPGMSVKFSPDPHFDRHINIKYPWAPNGEEARQFGVDKPGQHSYSVKLER